MKRVLAIFSALTKDWVRSKEGVFFSFLFPLLLLFIFGTVFGGAEAARFAIFVQNLDVDESGNATPLSQALIEALNATQALEVKTIDIHHEPLAYARNVSGFGARVRVLIIPDGFQNRAINGSIAARLSIMYNTTLEFLKYVPEQVEGTRAMMKELLLEIEEAKELLGKPIANLTIFLDPTDQSSRMVAGIVRSVVEAFNKRLVGAEDVLIVEEEALIQRGLRAVDYYLPGYIAAFIMTNGVIGVTSVMTEYKRRGLVKRLATTPLTKLEWVLGAVASQTALAFMLTAVMLLVGWLVFKITAIPDVYAIMLIITGAILFSGMGMLLAGVVKEAEAATALGNSIAFPMMFLSGSFWPLELMPSYLQLVAKFLPLTYFAEGLRSVLIYDDLQAALNNFVIVLVLALGFILIGAKVTEWRER